MTINVKTNSIQIADSYLVRERDMRAILLNAQRTLPEHPIWAREIDSLISEWCVHNACYKLHIARDRTKDVDLNYPCKVEWVYNILSPFAKLIIK